MTNEATQAVTEFSTAVLQVNTEKLGALLHADVSWCQPGNNSISGIKQSSAEAFQMVGKMFELSANTLELAEIKSISVNSNKVACLLNWKAAHPAGNALDIDNIDVIL
ncbi:MAG: nuclear transport factor 2 family protein [Ginsengibacter sp.]